MAVVPSEFSTKSNPPARAKGSRRIGLSVGGLVLLLFGLMLPLLATYYFKHAKNNNSVRRNLVQSSTGAQSRTTRHRRPRQLAGPNRVRGTSTSIETASLPKPAIRTLNPGAVGESEMAHHRPPVNEVSGSPHPSQQPPPPQAQEPRKNIFRIILEWIVGLFRKKKVPQNSPPRITSLGLSAQQVVRPCPPGYQPVSQSATGSSIQVSIAASDPDDEFLLYGYSVSGGLVTGSGSHAVWDLSQVQPGSYVITVEVDDGRGSTPASQTTTVTVVNENCRPLTLCPQVSITGPTDFLPPGTPATFSANVTNFGALIPRFVWTASAGTIASGQGTESVEVDMTGVSNTSIKVTVEITNVGPECNSTASLTISVASMPEDRFQHRVTLVGASGRPIVGAVVVLTNVRTGQKTEKRTLSDGSVVFGELTAGDFVVTATYGNSSISQEITIGGGTTNSTELRLPIDNKNGNSNTGPDANNSNVNNNTNENRNSNQKSNANTKAGAGPDDEKSDQLSYTYPIRFLKNTDLEISLSVDCVRGEAETSGTVINITGIPQHRNKQPLHGINDAPRGTEISMRATLETLENLKIVESHESWATYHREVGWAGLTWTWKVRVDETAPSGTEARFVLKIEYGYRPIGTTTPPLEQKLAWSDPFGGPVGLPRPIWLLSFLAVPGGMFMTVFGLFRKRRKDEVQCTAYAPSATKAGDSFPVLIYAHLKEQADGLDELAALTDKKLRNQARANLTKEIEQGSELTFELLLAGMIIDEPIQKHQWNGDVVEVPFVVAVPENLTPGTKFGKVIISQNGVPVGRLLFKLAVTDPQGPAIAPSLSRSDETYKRYENAFISYASEDRPKVLIRVSMLDAARIKYFMDMLSLDPGERWKRGLYKHIDNCDVVFLFWSKAARASNWVEKEVLYALDRRGGDDSAPPDIIPIIIEGPPPEPPPPALSFLHFNDKFLYLIYAAQAEKDLQVHEGDVG